MGIKKNIFLLFFITVSTVLLGQSADSFKLNDDEKLSPEEYISMFKNLAVIEMKRAKVPASITLAQGLLESGNGNSFLARVAQNHFGIKCGFEWTGRVVHLDDDSAGECFRAYDLPEESFQDHSAFLHKNSRYDTLFKLDSMDYKVWAYTLKFTGYATNPRYPILLISTIEKYELYRYDSSAVEPEFKALFPTIEVEAKKEEKLKNQFTYNGIPAYVVKEGETVESIAKSLEIDRLNLRKFNDLNDGEQPLTNTILYLKPKEKEGKTDFYFVKEGEGMYYISQLNFIRLKYLYKKNRMEAGQEPLAGEKIYLKDKNPNTPKLIPEGGFGPVRAGIIFTQLKKPFDALAVKNEEPKITKKDSVVTSSITPKKPTTTNENASLEDIDTSLAGKIKSSIESIDKQLEANKSNHLENEKPKDSLTANLNSDLVKDTTQKITLDTTKVKVIAPPVLKPRVEKEPSIKKEKKKGKSVTKSNPIVQKKDSNNIVDNIHVNDSLPIKITVAKKHIVAKNQTLFSISKIYKVSVEDLKKWNNLKENSIEKGQILFVSEPTIRQESIKRQKDNSVSPKPLYHTVEKGETLGSIAHKYKVSKVDLRELNKLNDDKVILGKKIRIR
ncbi:MAG: LysM peptidoglycan-binding domain-containing protein [Bacteroidetes bacterium]|nr:LysM peptidoglycan-binding domain-containing protein [Bacteroidota bacterium]